jgi:hypothetical protein
MEEKMIEKIYDEYCENRASASDEVRRTYDELHDAFDVYLSAVQEDQFRNAFMFGYAYGLKVSDAKMKAGVCA